MVAASDGLISVIVERDGCTGGNGHGVYVRGGVAVFACLGGKCSVGETGGGC